MLQPAGLKAGQAAARQRARVAPLAGVTELLSEPVPEALSEKAPQATCSNKRMARKTIHDVARAAGVAIKTVSRVLNDEPNVADQTRARVLAAVQALDYHPSLSARSLAGRRSYLIGLVYANPSANYIIDVQHGAMERCRKERFRLFVHQCSEKGEELVRDVMGLIDQTHMDGLIVA